MNFRADDSMEEEFITGIFEKVLAEVDDNGIVGKHVTIFLLGKVKELTKGKSLDAIIFD